MEWGSALSTDEVRLKPDWTLEFERQERRMKLPLDVQEAELTRNASGRVTVRCPGRPWHLSGQVWRGASQHASRVCGPAPSGP